MSAKDDAASRSSAAPTALPITRGNYAESRSDRSLHSGRLGNHFVIFQSRPFGIVRDSAQTAKMNDLDPQAWLADVLARIATYPAHRLDQLLPWNRTPKAPVMAAEAA
jgi:hypothetical protein